MWVPIAERIAPFSSTAVAGTMMSAVLCCVGVREAKAVARACRGSLCAGFSGRVGVRFSLWFESAVGGMAGLRLGFESGLAGEVTVIQPKLRFESVACETRMSTTLLRPYVNAVLASRINGSPCAAIFDGACFARLTNSLLLLISWLRSVLKSLLDACVIDRDRLRCWKDEIRYRWNRSVPADRGMGLGWDWSRICDWWESKARVSEMVVSGLLERRDRRDSMAARAGVRLGSLVVRDS